MIHIVTNHHKTPRWLLPQAAYLARHTKQEYKVYCGVTEFPEETDLDKLALRYDILKPYEFHKMEGIENNHGVKLGYLADLIKVEETDEEHLLFFLDPDAFPVQKGWDEFMSIGFIKYPKYSAYAISRAENPEPLLSDEYKPYPHPCFFATTLNFWKEHELSWEIDIDLGLECAGQLLKKWFDDNKYAWGKMTRTNCYNLHPLNYGVYANMIYHHGSGNRPVYDSIDIWSRPMLAEKYGQFMDLYFPELLHFNQRISDLVYEYLIADPSFIRMYFCGMERESEDNGR
jgi:hypothetical protein